MLKIPKHDINAENSILGLAIYEGSEMLVKARQYITETDMFYDNDNREIWNAMCEMYDEGTPIDAVLLFRKLRSKKSTSGDNWGYIISKKIDMNVTKVYLTNWCLALVEDYVTRISESAVFDLAHNDNAFDVAKDLDTKIKKAMNFNVVDDWSDMSQLSLGLIDRREKIHKGHTFGVKTGFKELDRITGGIEAGMVVIAARPSMGKTAFACSLAINMAQLGSTVGIISLEMPNTQLAGRFASIITGVEFWKVYRNTAAPNESKSEVDNKVNIGLNQMSSLPVFSTDNSKVNLSEIRWKAEKLVKTKGAKCIIIDYIQLISTEEAKNTTREREVAKLSSGIKAISKDLGIVMIVLAQLNRESETPDKVSRPGKLSQLRESDAILADADMGIIVDRPFKRGEKTDDQGNSTENKGAIIIEKFRNGETGHVDLWFDATSMHFRDEERPYEHIQSFSPIVTRPSFEAPVLDHPFGTQQFDVPF